MPNLPQVVLGAPNPFITEALNGRVAPSFFDTAKFLETTLGLPIHAEISPFTMTKDPTFEGVLVFATLILRLILTTWDRGHWLSKSAV
jgi:hypothetical protein